MDCKREDGLVYEVQPGKNQDGKKRRVLHRNILIPREAILEEPEEFHLKKKKHKPKQAASHMFANNTSGTESSEDEFQVFDTHSK